MSSIMALSKRKIVNERVTNKSNILKRRKRLKVTYTSNIILGFGKLQRRVNKVRGQIHGRKRVGKGFFQCA